MSTAATNELPSLSNKVVTGTAWSTVSTVGKQLLSIASIATVARKLGPEAYGVMGMAAVFIAFILNFRDLGTGTAIVQRLSISHRLLASLFWLNCLVGLAAAAIVAGASPLLARFFRTPELTAILCALSISFILSATGIVHNFILLREMRFKSLAVVDLGSGLFSYLVALTCAYSGFGVWSLVLANIGNSLSSTLLYWFFSSWRPTRDFDWPDVKSISSFSLNLSGFRLANYGYRNADNIIVGKVLGSNALGNYQVAYNLMLAPLQNISSVVGQVVFPAFAQMQEDNERFRSAYVRSSGIVALFAFPVMAGLGVVADPLLRAMLGAKWVGAIPIFQILAPVGLVQTIQTLTGTIFIAKGKTALLFKWGLINTAILIPAFLIGARYSATGVAIAYCIAYIGLLAFPGFLVPFRIIDLKFRQFLQALLPQFLLTLAMLLVCLGWMRLLTAVSIVNPWPRLISTSLLGAAVYLAGLLIFRPSALSDLQVVFANSKSGFALRATAFLQRFSRRP
jgi:O-antigen/teichoic acid export membrane protein